MFILFLNCDPNDDKSAKVMSNFIWVITVNVWVPHVSSRFKPSAIQTRKRKLTHG